jgi:hypothetical protein
MVLVDAQISCQVIFHGGNVYIFYYYTFYIINMNANLGHHL